MTAMMQIPFDQRTGELRELALNGACKYRIDHEMMHLDVEEVRNYRASANISGSLQLEVWALERPYQHDNFSGYLIACQQLGELNGQAFYQHCRYSIPLQKPAEGLWHLALLLREWDQGRFVTRDFINYPHRLRAEYTLALSLDDATQV